MDIRLRTAHQDDAVPFTEAPRDPLSAEPIMADYVPAVRRMDLSQLPAVVHDLPQRSASGVGAVDGCPHWPRPRITVIEIEPKSVASS